MQLTRRALTVAGLATLTVVFLLTFHALDGPRGGSVSTLKQQLARFSSTAGREGTPSPATLATARGKHVWQLENVCSLCSGSAADRYVFGLPGASNVVGSFLVGLQIRQQ